MTALNRTDCTQHPEVDLNGLAARNFEWPLSASFARVNLRAEYADLLDANIEEDDPRFDDHMAVMGTDFSAEVYATPEARDAALGPADRYVEFVAVSREEVEAVEYPKHQMAVGPALHEPGFEEVATSVVKAAIDFERGLYEDGRLQLEVTIARYQYTLLYRDGLSHPPQAHCYPRYACSDTNANHQLQVETVHWLHGLISREAAHWVI